MKDFFKKQKDLIIESFKIKRYANSILLEFVKYLLAIVIGVAAIALFIKSFMSMQPLLDIMDMIRLNPSGVSSDLISQFNQSSYLYTRFVFYAILLVVLALIVFVLLISLVDSYIMSKIRKEKWSKKLILRFLLTYLVITIIFFIIATVILIYVNNLAWILILLFLIFFKYIYWLSIFQATIDQNKKLKQNIVQGFKNMVLIVVHVIPGLIILLSLLVFAILCIILFAVLKGYSLIVVLLLLLTLRIWSKYYIFVLCNHITKN